MRAKIHRGAHEVGGSCIELESDGQRIVLDLGRPLWAGRDAVVPLPDVAGLSAPDSSLLGLVISHPHPDHYGLAIGLHDGVPLCMGEAGHRMLAEAAFFTSAVAPPSPHSFLRHREPLVIGPFTITPFLNDHSAFDAYSLLVEADRHRLFYTGDIRGHGRKRAIFEQLLRTPPRGIDVLLMEGTNIREGSDATHRGDSEHDVEKQLAATARATAGMVLAVYSPQNIDRLVTMHRAAVKSGRELVLDLYAATMAAATQVRGIPQASWDGVRVYVPRSQRRRVIVNRAFERIDEVRSARIYPDELQARASQLFLTFRSSMATELEAANCLSGAHAVWSLWPGYLDDASGVALRSFLEVRNIPLSMHHSSGHAFIPDLQRLVESLAPRRVVPIHSFATDRFAELFPRVDQHRDGSWWDV